MKFGGRFSFPQDEDLRFANAWVPVTPEKAISVKPHPILANPYANNPQGANWQQQQQETTGISSDRVQMGATYNGITQTVSPIEQQHANGGRYGYSYDVSLAEKTEMVDLITGSYSPGSFTELLCSGSSSWNNDPMTHLLHDQAAYVASENRNLSTSADIAANTALIPKFQPHLSNLGNSSGSFLLANQNFSNGSYPSSIVMGRSLAMDFPSQVDNSQRYSNSVHWLYSNQNPCSSSNPLNNGASSSQICQYGFPVPFLPSYDLINSLPRTEADAATSAASQLQFTTNQAKTLEIDELSTILKSFTSESASKEKGKQVKLVLSIGDEAVQKHSDGLLENIVESSSAAISTPYMETKDYGKEGDRGIDLNKTPQQKTPKRKKHRAKVVREGKPKRTPQHATPNINTVSNERRPAKRKYVRKNVQKESPGQLSHVPRGTIDPNAGKVAKSCTRVLRFGSQKSMDENPCRAVGQQEEMKQGNKRTFDLNIDCKGMHMGTGTDQVFRTNAAERIGAQNELMVENQIPGTMRNPTPSMTHILNNYPVQPEKQPSAAALATTKDVHMENLTVIRRQVENGNSDLCQRRCRDGYTPMQQQRDAQRIGHDVICAKTNGENLQSTGESIKLGGCQSVVKLLSIPSEARGSKRGYSGTIEHTHLSTNHPPSSLSCQEIFQMDRYQRNSCTRGEKFPESRKKQKSDNGYLSIYDMSSKVSPVEECLGKVEKKGENSVSSIGFASKLNNTLLSYSIESSRKIEGQNKGLNKFTSETYTHSMASGRSFLNQQNSSKSHSCQEFAQARSLSAHSSIETCNQLASSPSRKSFQQGNRQAFRTRHDNTTGKRQTVLTGKKEETVSQSVSSGTEKVLQEGDALYDNQKPSPQAIGFPIRTRYTISIDDITSQFNGLNLNGSCSKSIEHEKNVLVPYNAPGAVVPHDGTLKKRKPRLKVELDPETNRMWNLLMGKEGSVGIEETDEEKEKYWEEERKVFRGRVDSVIARMHLVQGDRGFSKWKGSVVDSVIGVFLTQNVSDHLSSSAFMSLAEKFPLKSSNCQAQDKVGMNLLVKAPQVRMTSPEDGTRWHEEVSSQPIYNRIFVALHEPAENQRGSETSGMEMNLVEAHSQYLEEEFAASQDSFQSSVTQAAIGIRSYSVPNSEAEDSITECQPNKIHMPLSTNQEMEKATTFQEFYQVNGSSVLTDGSNNGYIEYGKLKTRSDRIDDLNGTSSFTNLLNLHNRKMQVPFASSSNNQLYMYPDFGEPDPCGFGTFSQESISSWPPTASTFNIENGEKCESFSNEELSGSVVNASVQHNILWGSQNNYQPSSSNGCNHPSDYSHQCEGNQTFQLQNKSVRETPKYTELLGKKSGMHHARNEQLHSHGHPHNGTSTKISKGRKGKAVRKEQNGVDWDMLRKQVEGSGRKKERNEDTMDSLDYEAVRNADVIEISDAIRKRGMNKMLSDRIQGFLNRLVRDHGSIDLEWLRDVPPDKAKDYLLSIQGLGLKSVECVRLLTLHHVAFPVDTNVGRIAVRLGWVPIQPLPESLQLHLVELYPVLESMQKYLWPRLCKLDQLTLYELHYQLITFGKVFCTKSKPNCNACPMRGECRHFASAFASARLALPGPEEKSIVSSSSSIAAETNPTIGVTPMSRPPPENKSLQKVGTEINKCEPIIEEPATPEQEFTELSQSDIEDFPYEDPDEIPTIKLSVKELNSTIKYYLQGNRELRECDTSKALVCLNPDAAYIPGPELKFASRLRTEHQVYVLPDSHPLLERMDKREPDDPTPYLLAIWAPGQTSNSVPQPESRCGSQDKNKLCNEETCFSCNTKREENSQTVRGTILIPCRTAMRGSFPLNGTYFQVNEVFADHDSSYNPIDVPRQWIWNLPRRTAYFGASVMSIFRGLSTVGIQYCFWKGYVCVRGFDRKTRGPRHINPTLHMTASELTKTKKKGKR
ncbi:transcriptional activator DEMETER [Prunus persica]|uniref:transcriptional activator DEMETER n=1 Tax=Prunus persica TaxID=3760 RepID=UPI0009AB2F4C|nr:transcriptional activator DEMETER [Prunus persica]